MAIELQINNSANASARFVNWAPAPCRIRQTGGAAALTVKLQNRPGGLAGQVRFRATGTAAPASTLTVTLPASGAWVPLFVSGRFGFASKNTGDATVQVLLGTALQLEVPVTVRIRKNANTLTTDERNRLIAAFAALNNQGAGRFVDFRNMHTNIASPQAHGAPGFLPWHRIYLLDLERELQAIDPSVTLPYWRFDRPAPNLFSLDFLGVSDSLGRVQFSAANPLRFWRIDGLQQIDRRPLFNTATQAANVLSESQTLSLGTQYQAFESMEGDPHGSAHVSFGGWISSIGTAARDPLFFLLHTNVDRLWAKWQRANNRFDAAQAAAFDSNSAGGGNPIGHNLTDTMWPWNGVTGGQRPPTAPGGALAASPIVTAPGAQPRVRDALDYAGRIANPAQLGFAYDDVNYS